jgi:multisubunit Na+/H+ antiporter MnhB subunit
MSIGVNMSVVTAGAILAFATRVSLEGVSVPGIGMILMLVGLVGLVLQLTALRRRRRLTARAAAFAPACGPAGQGRT